MLNLEYIHPIPISRYARLLTWLMLKLRIKRELTGWDRKTPIRQKPAGVPWLFKALCRHAYTSEKDHFNQREVWTLTPTLKPPRQTIFYLHGGAYVFNLSSFHWRFLSRLCHHTQARIVIPDYPLVPHAQCEEVYDFLEALYEEVQARYVSTSMVLMGDSAGGGLALGLGQRMNIRQRPQPAQVILFSPWLDVTLTNTHIQRLEEVDPLLDRAALVRAGEAYRGHLEARDPRVSPLYGEMSSLGKLSIFVSTHDLLWPDCLALREMLQRQGIAHNYFEYPQLFHVWMMVVSLSEARHAMYQIVELLTAQEAHM